MKGTRVLVVEDDSIAARSLKTMLESFGCSVTGTVADGQEAILQARETGPDIILMDIWLKGDLDGIDTARQIQNTGRCPIIYLTAYADDETLARAKVTGPYGYIVKPIDPRDLHIAIDMALYKYRMEREREELIAELKEALGTVRQLTGLLPVCPRCKRIRASDGTWHRIEAYIRDRSEADSSHGACPDCERQLYPEFSVWDVD